MRHWCPACCPLLRCGWLVLELVVLGPAEAWLRNLQILFTCSTCSGPLLLNLLHHDFSHCCKPLLYFYHFFCPDSIYDQGHQTPPYNCPYYKSISFLISYLSHPTTEPAEISESPLHIGAEEDEPWSAC
jgi:hypothetical protein